MSKKHAVQTLPETYGEYCHIDLQEDKKTALRVNLLALLLMAVVFAAGIVISPGLPFAGLGGFRIIIMALGMILYMVLHEFTHGITMRLLGGQHVKYGFTGMYAYAGSDVDFFDRTAYRIIALCPVAVWGVIFAALCFLLPDDWFWIVYLWQIINVSGSAGDLYVTFRCAKMPADILVKDTGVEMRVFSGKEG